MIARFFVDRPVLANVLAILFVLIGGVALFGLPVAQLPDVVPPTVQVTTRYPGASAQDVMNTVALPIEQQVNGVRDMLYMQSNSTADGGYSLNLQTSDLAAISNSEAYLKISTVNHPDGEITGTFGKTAGSQTAPAVPSYPSWPDQHATNDAANSRFLTQATGGPSLPDMADLKTNGYRNWIENQFNIPSTHNLPYILANLSNDPQNPYSSPLFFNSWWKNSVAAPDQLRQRAAFALSEILVVSDTGPLNNNGRTLADYYDTLLDNFLEISATFSSRSH